MSSDITIDVAGLSKCYRIYDKPSDRLKQSLYPRLAHLVNRQAPQYFSEFWALRDITFSVQKGETVGIIGRNGSGKSTLLQIISGTVAPTAGTARTSGRVAALLELGAGFNTEFTGRENVLFNAAILGFDSETMLARMDEVLAFSELGDFLDQPVKTYSSGMYARLAFSIAIHVDPEILIVDEALAVGDARFVAKCMRRIKEIKDKGTTILFVSHDVGSIRTLCERTIWLDKGRLVEQGHVFPVTGRYMEFMFQEDAPASQVHVILQDSSVPALALEGAHEAGRPDTSIAVAQAADNLTVGYADQAPVSEHSKPVTHWGSHKGTIRDAKIRDENGVRHDVFHWGAELVVTIEVAIPATMERHHLSVAFSIKDLNGSDLIVSTTHDFNGTSLPPNEHFTVRFKLANYLLEGKYLLVAAVENRQHANDIHYYEYVEGAHYFSVLSDAKLFGKFQPPIQQSIVAI